MFSNKIKYKVEVITDI